MAKDICITSLVGYLENMACFFVFFYRSTKETRLEEVRDLFHTSECNTTVLHFDPIPSNTKANIISSYR